MPYRDERDALRFRVKDLEDELAASREVIARLQGERASEAVRDQKPSWFTGAPTRLDLEQELPFEVTDDGYEAIADLLRERLPAQGQISQVGRTLTFRMLGRELRISRTDGGATQVRLAVDHRGSGTAFALALPGAVILAMAPIGAALQAAGHTPLALLLSLPILITLVYGALRPLVGRAIRKDRDKLTGVFESVVQVAGQHAKPARVRVARDAEPSAESAEEVVEAAEDADTATGAGTRAAGE